MMSENTTNPSLPDDPYKCESIDIEAELEKILNAEIWLAVKSNVENFHKKMIFFENLNKYHKLFFVSEVVWKQ